MKSKLFGKVGMDLLSSVLDNNRKREPYYKQLDNSSRAFFIA